MQKQKRRQNYLNVKSYVKNKPVEVRFPFHPSLERPTKLEKDVRYLEMFQYEPLVPQKSEVICESQGHEARTQTEIRTDSETY